jgi:hypothetical protein
MRLPRMTIRRWMMTVILATAFITVAQIGERWRKFQNLAVEAEIEKLSAWVRAFVDYHSEMSRKYRRAASRPWVRVDPDPPPLEP